LIQYIFECGARMYIRYIHTRLAIICAYIVIYYLCTHIYLQSVNPDVNCNSFRIATACSAIIIFNNNNNGPYRFVFYLKRCVSDGAAGVLLIAYYHNNNPTPTIIIIILYYIEGIGSGDFPCLFNTRAWAAH